MQNWISKEKGVATLSQQWGHIKRPIENQQSFCSSFNYLLHYEAGTEDFFHPEKNVEVERKRRVGTGETALAKSSLSEHKPR